MQRQRHVDARPGELEGDADDLVVVVRGRTDAARIDRRDALVMWSLAATGLLTAAFVDRHDMPVVWSLGLGVGAAALLDRLLIGPLVRFGLRLGAESARLRAALACPYCKDALLDDAAIACDRQGCGAFYHGECWAEVGATYGGCAIYGCGSRTGHAVGRFALQRHVLRLLLAAALFTPKLVRRIQETERQSFRDVWRRAREYQAAISRDEGRTLALGCVNLILCMVGTGGLVSVLVELGIGVQRWSEGAQVAFVLAVPCALALAFLRMPLAGHFGRGASKLLGRVFRDELAALGRADQGTFLARLAGGAGKKDA